MAETMADRAAYWCMLLGRESVRKVTEDEVDPVRASGSTGVAMLLAGIETALMDPEQARALSNSILHATEQLTPLTPDSMPGPVAQHILTGEMPDDA